MELDIDKRNRALGLELRKNVAALQASVKAGLETAERNRQAEKRAHELFAARQDAQRKERSHDE